MYHLRNKVINLRHSTKGGAVTLLLNKVRKSPLIKQGGSIGSNRIVGITSSGGPALPNARNSIAGGDLLNSINFNRNAKKSSNIKFIY